MTKLDLKKALRDFYLPSSKAPAIVEVPRMRFLMIDGAIEPGTEPGNSPGFVASMGAIYGAAYTIKFASKRRTRDPVDYPVMALEGLWWVDDGEFDLRRKDNWRYTLMIMQPEHVDDRMLAAAVERLRAKRPTPEVDALRLEDFEEGLCVQIMHIGPYAEEPETIDRMRELAESKGYRFCNKHHEIYVGDPRRSAPAKLKTVLRHAVVELA